MIQNNATLEMIQNIINGTTPPSVAENANDAQQLGGIDASGYALAANRIAIATWASGYASVMNGFVPTTSDIVLLIAGSGSGWSATYNVGDIWTITSVDTTSGIRVNLGSKIGNIFGNMLGRYPVGSVYISTVSTSPASVYGGTWTSISGYFLIGANSSYPVRSTGGATTHTHSAGSLYGGFDVESGSSGATIFFNLTNRFQGDFTSNNKLVGLQGQQVVSDNPNRGLTIYGSTASASNMPPYFAVYMWRRTG